MNTVFFGIVIGVVIGIVLMTGFILFMCTCNKPRRMGGKGGCG